jgi:hypothetical protein
MKDREEKYNAGVDFIGGPMSCTIPSEVLTHQERKR